MKGLLLLLSVITTGFFAQNIDEQRVTFKYEQKPLISIDKSIPYALELNLEKYNQKSEDSIVKYDYEMSQFEAQYAAWYLRKQEIDKNYLLQMSTWEKQRITTPTLAQPIKQSYPLQPFKEDVDFPIMLNPINDDVASGVIQLAGFTNGQGGMKVIYEPQGIENVKLEEKIKGTGATASISYALKYSSPYTIQVIDPSGAVILSHSGGENIKSYTIGKFDNKYGYEYWKIDNYDLMWKKVQESAISDNLVEANNLLNSEIGYPVKSMTIDIYTVKKFKGMDYSDFIKAYTLAKKGYLSIENESPKMVKAQLSKAIKIWEQAEKESYIQDRKARVNKKVTAILYVNLARAYLWSDNYSKADYYIQKAIAISVYKYKNDAKRLQGLVDMKRKRFIANK